MTEAEEQRTIIHNDKAPNDDHPPIGSGPKIAGRSAARRRATARYKEQLGRESPEGFRRLRVHDLRHTFGRRLRAAGMGLEDRQELLGHEAGRVTTHYSTVEVGNLIQAANQVIKSRGSPERAVLRIVG